MTMFGIDELPVKPRMRGWIHLYAFGVAVVVAIILVTVAFSLVSGTAGVASAVYAVSVCGVFGVSAAYHRIHWATTTSRTWMKRADHSMFFYSLPAVTHRSWYSDSPPTPDAHC